MKIKLKKLMIVNFKGLRNLSIDFTDITNISGENGTGKTSIFDAFCWLLFNKDSEGSADFSVKPLPSVPQTSVEVTGQFVIDHQNVEFKKILVEKWSKNEFKGNETEYYYNGVPCQQKMFKEKIASYLSEDSFKLLTNPFAFNSLHWEKQRGILFSMVQSISDIEICNLKPDFKGLIDSLIGKDILEYKKEIASKIRGIKEQLISIPIQIAEINRNLPDIANYDEVVKQGIQLKADLESIENQISNINAQFDELNKVNSEKRNSIVSLQQKIGTLKLALATESQKEQFAYQSKKSDLSGKINQLKSDITSIDNEINRNVILIEHYEKEVDKLRETWTIENERSIVLKDTDLNCPACKRPLDNISEIKDSLTANFNLSKAEKLKEVSENAALKNGEIVNIKNTNNANSLRIFSIKDNIEKLEAELNLLIAPQARLTTSAEIQDIESEITAIKETIKESKPDTENLLERRKEIQNSLLSLREKAGLKKVHDTQSLRVKELSDNEKNINQELMNFEKIEQTIKDFTKVKIDLLETSINGMFKYAKFKLFNILINGNYEETCECLVNGVPFSSANNAAKINYGIDIINTLSAHYQISAPIFIDNRESVNDLIETQAQIINLIVTKETLKIY